MVEPSWKHTVTNLQGKRVKSCQQYIKKVYDENKLSPNLSEDKSMYKP